MTTKTVIKLKKEDNFSLLSAILSDIPFSEKVEAVRKVNPHFYLLTPTPKKGNGHGL